ncbi:uncharacterized protein si:dkey-192g7.3 isoform X1 [Pygocentrus nattereri]|uniref:uncharacterized protein si:dkey-192g7.3 isoform X1 n=1 Tax=Pygocentrus nattereri TaxID=42514 RepID=UPI001890DDA4|nr:uncharacterized protein si:dkey-192g7.3 isoform X1 [Pygocentrus nattereri]
MTLSRTVNLMCILVMLTVGCTAADIEMTAFIGENVLLPCPCSETTDQVTWQINGKPIVVNHYNAEDNTPRDDSFTNKSRLFLPYQKGNCSLLLFQVSSEDQKIFTCYTFNESHMNTQNINLTVIAELPERDPSTDPLPIGETKKLHAGLLVGILLTLAVVSGVLGFLLLRKQRQRTQRMGFMDPQAGLPMVKPSPV